MIRLTESRSICFKRSRRAGSCTMPEASARKGVPSPCRDMRQGGVPLLCESDPFRWAGVGGEGEGGGGGGEHGQCAVREKLASGGHRSHSLRAAFLEMVTRNCLTRSG